MAELPIHVQTSTIINATSMGADITSTVVDARELVSYSVQAIWSAGSTPIGVLILQGSNDNSNWTDISAPNVSGNNGSIMINVEKHAYLFVRCFYDRTSGGGTLTVILAGKRG